MNKHKIFRRFAALQCLTLLLNMGAQAGLPPTTSKGSGDSSNIPTFNFLLPNFAVSHSGVTATVGTLAVGGGGTGLTSPGSSGNVLQSNGTSWVSATTPAAVLSVSSKTANYSVTSTDDVIIVDGTSSAFTITLPDATTATKKIYRLKRKDSTLANKVSIATTSAQTIDGNAGTTYGLFTINEEFDLIPDGSNWQIAQHKSNTATASFTPTFGGIGTAASVQVSWARRANKMVLSGTFQTGTVTASLASVGLPSGTQVDSSGLSGSGQPQNVGLLQRTSGGAGYQTTTLNVLASPGSSTTALYFAPLSGGSPSSNALTPQAANGYFGNSEISSFFAEIPILGWNE